MSPRGPAPVAVSGGSGGISANADDIAAAAARFAAVGDELAGARRDVLGLAESSLADGRVTVDVFGPQPPTWSVSLADARGLARVAAGDLWAAGLLCTAIARSLWAAATGYGRLEQLFDRGNLVHLVSRLLGSVGVGEAGLLVTHDVSRSAQLALTNDPELTAGLAGVSGITAAVEVLADRDHDGHGIACPTGVDTWAAAGSPPRRLTDIVADLALRNDDTRHGEIDVRILTMPDGTRKAIVDITGTKSWTPHPGPDVTDLTTNVLALAGRRTAYEAGVLAAMRQAGVGRHDDVMLVGHSQGGLIAVNAARHAAGRFRITHVVTAGAPVGRLVGSVPAVPRCWRWRTGTISSPPWTSAATPTVATSRPSPSTWATGRSRAITG